MAGKIVTQVIDQGDKLELYFNAGENVCIDKSSIKLRLTGNKLFLYDNSMSDTVIEDGTKRVYTLLFASITSPNTASAVLLQTAILAMLNTGGGSTSGLALESTLEDVLTAINDSNIFLDNINQTVEDIDAIASTLSLESTQQDVLLALADITTNTGDLNLESTQQDVLTALGNLESSQGDIFSVLNNNLPFLSLESTQQNIVSYLQTLSGYIDTNLSDLASEATLETLATESTLATLNLETTQQSVLTALGTLATENTVSNIEADLQYVIADLDSINNNIDVELSTVATEATLLGINDSTDALKMRVLNNNLTAESFSNATLAGLQSDLQTWFNTSNPTDFLISINTYKTALAYEAIVIRSTI